MNSTAALKEGHTAQENTLGFDYPNIEKIYGYMRPTLRSESSDHAKALMAKRDTILKEFRTLSIGLPRQVGKTRWAASKLADGETCLFFVGHTSTEAYLEPRVEEFGITPEMAKGVLPYDELLLMILRNDPFPARFKRVIVDEASYIFNTILRRGKFYRWLAEHAPADVEVILIA